MARTPIFVDTWGWLALGHGREPRHEEVKQIYQELLQHKTPIYTSDYVLDELITLLFRRERFDEAVRFVEGILGAAVLEQVRIVRITPKRFAMAWELRKRFQDKPTISFTDLVSMAIMHEYGLSQILTADVHFLQVGMGFLLVPERFGA